MGGRRVILLGGKRVVARYGAGKKEHKMNHEIKPDDQSLAFHDDGLDSDKSAAESNVLQLALPQHVVAVPARKPTRKLVTTLTLSSRTCKWPIGDPAQSGFHYCGLPPQSGRPYCDTHDSMSYQATPRKKTSSSFR
jgi:hypothetical protein